MRIVGDRKWGSSGPGYSADSATITNETIIRKVRVPNLGGFWQNDESKTGHPDMRHYWTASFLLPIGSILVLALVILLMVLFKRCPQMVAAIVASILGVIIIFVSLISLNRGPIYD